MGNGQQSNGTYYSQAAATDSGHKIREALANFAKVIGSGITTASNAQLATIEAENDANKAIGESLRKSADAHDDRLREQNYRIANQTNSGYISNPYDINLNNAIAIAHTNEAMHPYEIDDKPDNNPSDAQKLDSDQKDAQEETQQERWMQEGYDYAIDNAARGNDAALQSGLDAGWITYNDDYWTYETVEDEDGNEVSTWVLKDDVDPDELDPSDYYVLNDDWEDFFGDIYIDPDNTFEDFWIYQFDNDANGDVYDEALAQYGGDSQALYDAIRNGEYNFYTDGDDYTDTYYGLDDVSRTIVEMGIISDAISAGALDSDDPYAKKAIADWDNYTTVLGNYQNGTATSDQLNAAWGAYYQSTMDLANQVIGDLYMERYENGEYAWEDDPEEINSAFDTISYAYGFDSPYGIKNYVLDDDFDAYLEYNDKYNLGDVIDQISPNPLVNNLGDGIDQTSPDPLGIFN